MTKDRPRTAARLLVIANCAVFVAFGFGLLLFPARFAEWVGIQLTSPSAFADLRAVYGGLSLSVAALFWQGLRNPDWFGPSLFLATASSGGLAAARLYSIAASGMPNALVLGFLASELAAFALGLYEFRALVHGSSGSAAIGSRTVDWDAPAR